MLVTYFESLTGIKLVCNKCYGAESMCHLLISAVPWSIPSAREV